MFVSESEFERLKRLSGYRTAISRLSTPAWGAMFLGVIGMVVGGLTINMGYLAYLIALMGLALFGAGLRAKLDPSPGGQLILGYVLIFAAIWDFSLLVLLDASSGSFWLALPLLQLAWSIQTFRVRRQISDAFPEPPSRESMKAVDDLVRSLKTRIKTNKEESIRFDVPTLTGSRVKWRGTFVSEYAVFMHGRREIIIEKRNAVRITPERKLAMQSKFKAVLLYGKETMEIFIHADDLGKFSAWKYSDEAPQTPEPVNAGPSPAPEIPFSANSPFFAGRN